MICKYLENVFKIVWHVGLFETLEHLFDETQTVDASEELYNQLLQTLPTEKQELLRKFPGYTSGWRLREK